MRLCHHARRTLKILKRWLPVDAPLRVRGVWHFRSEGERIQGMASWDFKKSGLPKSFDIVIDSSIPPRFQAEVVVHEYAHAMAWREQEADVTMHTPEWAVAYGRAYRTAFEGSEGE